MRKLKLLSRNPNMLRMLLILFVLFAWTGNSLAQGVNSGSPFLPSYNGQYISPALYHQYYGTAGFIDNGTHNDFLGQYPPPLLGAPPQPHTFGSHISAMFHPISGPAIPISGNATVTTLVNKTSGVNPNAGTYNTEMLQLDLVALPVMIRESPTLQSLGQTTITDLGGGQYHIDSFFDIFTEISLDNGLNWIPGTIGPGGTVASSHMQLTGASAIPTMTEWALIACGVLLLIGGSIFIMRRQVV